MLPGCKDARTEERKRGGCDRWERNNRKKILQATLQAFAIPLKSWKDRPVFFIKVRGKNNDETSPAGPGACRALN